ncbi:MAG: hypothetical protein Fur005_43330 [Roseiflexaceae bacterium]
MSDPIPVASERLSRALTVLYNISIACRGQVAFRPIFEAIATELRGLFPFDACYIAVCDMQQPGYFRAALLIDEGTIDYEEDTDYGVLTGMIMQQHTPLLFDDLAAERGQMSAPTSMFGNVQKFSRAWMGVPLLLGDDAVGVISLQSYQPNRYDQADLDLLQRVGNLAAVLIENANLGLSQRELSLALSEQVAARTRELETLGVLAAEMVRGYPLNELIERAIDRIVALFGFDAAIIRRIEADDQLSLVAQRGMPEAYMQIHQMVPMSGTLLGKVIAENRILVVGPEYAIGLRERGLDFQSVLSVPLRIGQQVLGGMSLLCQTPRYFTQEECDVALALANQVAIAIENDRLFAERDRRVAELSALSAIARAASSSHDLATLFRRVYDALAELLPLDAFSMVVYEPQRRIITDGISIDEGQQYAYWQRQPPPPDSLTAWILQQVRPLHFDDLLSEIHNYPELAGHVVGSGRHSVSWLGVPLISRDNQPIGVIAVQSYTPAMFSERDETFLINVAGQVALHVQNVALLERRARQIRELDAIGRISREVSAALSLDAMHLPVYRILRAITDASSFFLIICEPHSHRIRHAYYIDGGEEIFYDWPDGRPPDGSLTAWILRETTPLLFDDLHLQQSAMDDVGVRPVAYGSDASPRSWVGVPIRDADGLAIGTLALQDGRPYQYDQQTIELLEQVALHISLGVQKVALFEAERTARQTADTLREVAKVLNSTFDPNEVLEIILRELQRVVPYHTASIMLNEGEALRVVAVRGWDEALAPRGVTFSFDRENAAVRVVRERSPIMFSDTTSASDWQRTEWGDHIRSWLGVPLVAKGHVLGILNIDSSLPNRFSQRDVEVALTFASQAALSLENARLYAESITRVEQELAIARSIQSNLFPRTLPTPRGLQVAAQCLPARETGGDFYDCFMLEQETLALMVGDASGKSIPGAMLMAIARSVARSEARDHIEPAAVLQETNRLVALDVPRGSFVALSYATIDANCRTLALASAGQLAPIRRRVNGQVEYLIPGGPGFPLGIAPEIAYAAYQADLEVGDTLIFYTDGVVEAHDHTRQMFGFERLEALISEYGHEPPDRLLARILAAVGAFMGPVHQHDDMTVMIVRVAGETA